MTVSMRQRGVLRAIHATGLMFIMLGACPAVGAGVPADPGITRNPSATATEARALQAHRQALDAMRQQDLPAAADHLRRSLSLAPERASARHDYAHLLLAIGRPGRAMDVLARGLQLTPGDADTARLLAQIGSDQGQPERAVQVLEQAARVNPDANSEMLAHLAALYREQRNPAKAAAIYARLLEREPDNPRWILGSAATLERSDRTRGALAAWQRLRSHQALAPAILEHAAERVRALRQQIRAEG